MECHDSGNRVLDYSAFKYLIYPFVRLILHQFLELTGSTIVAAAVMISTFLKSSNHNLKYVGIDALSRIVRINANYANEHQIAVIDCLEDPDETLKKKTLELLFKMTSPNNVEVSMSSRRLVLLACAQNADFCGSFRR